VSSILHDVVEEGERVLSLARSDGATLALRAKIGERKRWYELRRGRAVSGRQRPALGVITTV